MTSDPGHLDFGRLLSGFDAAEKAKAQQRALEQLLQELSGIADALCELERHCADLEGEGVRDVPRKSVEVVRRRLTAVLEPYQVDPSQTSPDAERSKTPQRRLEHLLVELLSIADALHELEQHCADLRSKGVEGAPRQRVNDVLHKLLAVLKSQQVERMDCKRQPFDLERHEVLEVRQVRGMADDIVLEEVVQGYVWNDRVLRHAKVVISRAENAPEPLSKRARRRKRKLKDQN
jgi:molecular chaperone GrpE (heat shock protein)